MIINILTIFPEMVSQSLRYGIIGRAVRKKLLKINAVDLRSFAKDKHKTVDCRPFGGGPGMVLRLDIIDAALSGIKKSRRLDKTILLSPQGLIFNQAKAKTLSRLNQLTLICGRYEGVDERVREHLVDEELSIGNYVLSGGEIPALVVADAVSRLVPGVIGNEESLVNESFSNYQSAAADRRSPNLDFPQFTKPAEYRGWKVPAILLSGDHAKIEKWRRSQSRPGR